MPKKSLENSAFSTPKIVAWIVGVLFIIAFYFICADQRTPYSKQAVIYGHVLGISPEVSGRVVQLNIDLTHQFVAQGKTIFTIEARPYQLEYEIAKNNLVLAQEKVAQLQAQIGVLQQALNSKKATLDRTQQDLVMAEKLYKKQIMSLRDYQHAVAAFRVSQADTAQAEMALQQAQLALGASVNGVNIHIKQAQDQLNLAAYRLSKTQVVAPVAGYVENLYLHPGDYVTPGVSKVPFVVAGSWWLEGLAPENTINHIKIGNRALIVTDLYPGRVLRGLVSSVGYGVEIAMIRPSAALPEYDSAQAWFKPQQVFPFGVSLDATKKSQKDLELRIGATASIVVLEPHNYIWNGFAYFVMWIKSLWAYL